MNRRGGTTREVHDHQPVLCTRLHLHRERLPLVLLLPRLLTLEAEHDPPPRAGLQLRTEQPAYLQASLAHALELLLRERGGAREQVRLARVAVLPVRGAVDGVGDALAEEYGAHRGVPAAEALRDWRSGATSTNERAERLLVLLKQWSASLNPRGA